MSRFEKWTVLWSTVVTALTGIAYLWVKYMMAPTDPYSVINHPLQPVLLKAHILVAPLLVFAGGLIAVRHIWRHYKVGTKDGRRSGISAGYSLWPMVVTGYLIQAVTSETLLPAVAYSHIGLSLLFCVALLIHAIIFTRDQRRGARQSSARSRPARRASSGGVRGHVRPTG